VAVGRSLAGWQMAGVTCCHTLAACSERARSTWLTQICCATCVNCPTILSVAVAAFSLASPCCPTCQVLVGNPSYRVTAGNATFKGVNLLDLKPQQRARMGLFLRWARAGVSLGGWWEMGECWRVVPDAQFLLQLRSTCTPLAWYAAYEPTATLFALTCHHHNTLPCPAPHPYRPCTAPPHLPHPTPPL